jgi:hypothetical protein
VAKLARATGGSTIRNTAGMPLTAIGVQRINSVREEEAKAEEGRAEPVVQVALAVRVVRVASAELVGQVALEVPVALAEPVVRVALVVPVASAEPAVQVALVVPVASAVPVVRVAPAELELGQVAVALSTKSVTAALRYGLLAALEAEDLVVAVVGTTREPAAAEAVVAWAAAE